MDALFIVTNADRLAPDHPTGVWLEEFAIPWVALCEGGISIVTASPKGGAAPIDPASAVPDERQARWAKAIEALGDTVPLGDLAERRFDAIVVPGGHGPLVDLAQDSRVADMVSVHANEGRIVAALCHGPAALLNARNAAGGALVADRKVTAFTDGEERAAGLAEVVPFLLEDRLRSLGAKFESALLPALGNVVRDGNLITGQNPASSEGIARCLLVALGERQRAALEVAAAPS